MSVGSGASGTLHFDDFEARRLSYIGVLTDPGIHNPAPFEYIYTSQPDGTEGEDTRLSSANPTSNFGTAESFPVGESNSATD